MIEQFPRSDTESAQRLYCRLCVAFDHDPTLCTQCHVPAYDPLLWQNISHFDNLNLQFFPFRNICADDLFTCIRLECI